MKLKLFGEECWRLFSRWFELVYPPLFFSQIYSRIDWPFCRGYEYNFISFTCQDNRTGERV